MTDRSPPPARLIPFFFGVFVALAVGVPATLFVLAFLADNVASLITGVLGALLAFGLLAVVAFGLRHRLFRWAQGRGVDSLGAIADPLTVAARAAKAGDTAAAFAALEEAGRLGVAFWGWLAVRRWILRILLGLAASFAGLVGSALLYQQNALIKQQNDYWREQNARLQVQIDGQAEADRHAQRTAYVATLYDELPSCVAAGERTRCPPVASLRARAEVAGALVQLERARQACSADAALAATIANGADCPRPDLRHVQLSGASLDGADFRWANLERARFVDANLRGARLDGAVLDAAELAQVDLTGASLRAGSFVGAKLASASLERADLRGADLRRADLTGVDLSDADLRGVQWAAAQLDEVSLTGARVDEAWSEQVAAARGFEAAKWIRCPSGRLAERDTGCKE